MARRRFASTALSDDNMNGVLDQNRRNLVRNAGFEGWDAGTSVAPTAWEATLNGGTIARTSTAGEFYEGSYAVKLAQTSGGAGDTRIEHDVYGRLGIGWRSKAIVASVYVKCAAASTAKLRLDDGVSTSESIHTGTGAWERLVVQLTVSASASALKVVLEIAKPGAGSTEAMFDAVALSFGDAEGMWTEPAEDRLADAVDFDNNGAAVEVRVPRILHGTATFSLTGGSATETKTVTYTRGFQAVYAAQATMRCAAGTHDDYSVKVTAITATQITFLFRKDGGGNLGAADAPVVNYAVFGCGYSSPSDQW